HKKRKFVPSFRGRHATVLSSPRTSHLMVLFCLLFTKQTVRSFPLENTFRTLEKTRHNSGYALAIVWFHTFWFLMTLNKIGKPRWFSMVKWFCEVLLRIIGRLG